MTTRDQLGRLASLIEQRNHVDAEIAAAIGCPAHPGHVGEFAAAAIFDIGPLKSATHPGADGHLARGPLAGRSVNIKKYSLDQGLLDIRLDALPDFFLVLTGARTPAESSRGTTQPWTIESVYLPARSGPACRAARRTRRQDRRRLQHQASRVGRRRDLPITQQRHAPAYPGAALDDRAVRWPVGRGREQLHRTRSANGAPGLRGVPIGWA